MIRDMRQRLWRGQRGFTLVEVILALLVFGLTSTAVVAGLTTASKGSEFAQENYTAVALVRSEVEYIKEQPFVDLPSPPPQRLPAYSHPRWIRVERHGCDLDRRLPLADHGDRPLRQCRVV